MKAVHMALGAAAVLAIAYAAHTYREGTAPARHAEDAADSASTPPDSKIPETDVASEVRISSTKLAPAIANPTRHSPVETLNGETVLLQGNSLNSKKITEVLSDDAAFQLQFKQMERDAATDVEARAQSEVYRATLIRELHTRLPSSSLNNLACGLSLCIGSIRSQDSIAHYRSWRTSLMEQRGFNLYALTDRSTEVSPGYFEHRFVFSMDARSARVSIPPMRSPAKG